LEGCAAPSLYHPAPSIKNEIIHPTPTFIIIAPIHRYPYPHPTPGCIHIILTSLLQSLSVSSLSLHLIVSSQSLILSLHLPIIPLCRHRIYLLSSTRPHSSCYNPHSSYRSLHILVPHHIVTFIHKPNTISYG